MSSDSKDVVESYMDALLEPPPLAPHTGLIECVLKEGKPKESTIKRDSHRANSFRDGRADSIEREGQSPAVYRQRKVTEPEPLKQAISDLEDVCKLEESRREELQAILTRQTLLAPENMTATSKVKEKVELAVSATKNVAQTTVSNPLNIQTKAKTVVLDAQTPSKASSVTSSAGPLSEEALGSSLAAPKAMKPEENAPSEQQASLKLEPPAPWCEDGRPPWAQIPFSALLFKVSGLTLAVPLISLGQIHQITEKMTPIFGQADWFMGLQDTPNGHVKTVNTALYVMPERYNSEFVGTAKYVISIVGLGWGLAVDEVQQPMQLNPEDITWRTERSKRPWLAGTVKSAMCALIDVPQLGFELEKAQR